MSYMYRAAAVRLVGAILEVRSAGLGLPLLYLIKCAGELQLASNMQFVSSLSP
jgi:hypothetical protein